MTGIPEGWPPDPASAQPLVAPLFPLADVWLFPGAVLPLHIFEPRYRRMIEDCLDGPGRIVMGTVMQGHEDEMSGAPPCYSVAGLGEIGHHKRLEDGRFNVLLVGLTRVRIREVEGDEPYRKVEMSPLYEIPATGDEAAILRQKLETAVCERSDDIPKLPKEMGVGRLADLLTLRLPLGHSELNELYCQLDAKARAKAVLDEHLRLPKPQK